MGIWWGGGVCGCVLFLKTIIFKMPSTGKIVYSVFKTHFNPYRINCIKKACNCTIIILSLIRKKLKTLVKERTSLQFSKKKLRKYCTHENMK